MKLFFALFQFGIPLASLLPYIERKSQKNVSPNPSTLSQQYTAKFESEIRKKILLIFEQRIMNLTNV